MRSLRGRGRGRPRRPVTIESLAQVDELLEECGGRISFAELLRICTIPRSTLRAHVDAWRKRHAPHLFRLQWNTPGAVWAMDWTELDEPIEIPRAPIGLDDHDERRHQDQPRNPCQPTITCRWALVIRDLATSMQLLALPAVHATAQVAADALRMLFTRHGAPLVLKTDNGSNVAKAQVPPLLQKWRVIHLLSPPGTPRYNGAIEAGIGSIKMRLNAIAASHGRPGAPTADDLEQARLEANHEVRSRSSDGLSPDQAWAARAWITTAHREALALAIREAMHTQIAAMPAPDQTQQSNATPICIEQSDAILSSLDAVQRATLARRAIRRALEALAYLTMRKLAISSTHQND